MVGIGIGELNREQREAVTTDAKKAVVFAGPGSGKTRVLVNRVKHLLLSGVRPDEIVISTFTRKAAEEIKERLCPDAGQAVNLPFCGTFHSIAVRLLGQTSTGEAIPIVTPMELELYVEIVAKRVAIKKKDILALLDELFTSGITDGSCFTKDGQGGRFKYAWLILNELNKNGVSSYGGLLLSLHGMLGLGFDYFGFRHILIDEAQDMDLLQWKIAADLAKFSDANLFIVGDANQSIYEWRGGDPGLMMDFAASDDCSVYQLVSNYRSGQIMCHYSNALIGDKVSVPARDLAGRIDIKDYVDFTDAIVKLSASSFFDRGDDHLHSVLILARTRRVLQGVAEALSGEGVAYKMIGSHFEVSKTREFCQFNALLRLLVTPHSDFFFEVASPLFQLNKGGIEQVSLYATRKGYSMLQAAIEMCELKLITQPSSLLGSMGVLYAARRFSCQPGDAAGSLRELLFTLDADCRMSIGGAVMAIIDYIEDVDNSGSIRDFCLRYFDVVADIDQNIDLIPGLSPQRSQPEGIGTDRVILSTIHGAKGLEADSVVILGCNDGDLPIRKAIGAGGKELEAERRLMYVAMTRARQHLVLCYKSDRERSRFLYDMFTPSNGGGHV